MKRRLAAILAADVVDYTRLMGEDDARTLAALNELRETVFQPKVAGRNGKVVKRMGDGWLVEFPNVSDAVACAIDIQKAIAGHDVIRLRIGIHIGDVTFQTDDIYGDGINVAARLETLAEPGQVLISDTVQQSLDSKTTAKFAGGEAHQLKNVARPVAVWRWPADVSSDATKTTGNPNEKLTLPDRPSIAVLPFDNMSGDIEQEYFSDGISEDLITALSHVRWLFVIARNSSFTFKGRSVNVRTVADELGVRYVLEGSVRKAGNRVRINAQLIDARNGSHVWADRYDRELADIFELQDEITSTIAAKVDAELMASERSKALRKPTDSLDAWDCYQRGMWHVYRFNQKDTDAAMSFFRKAAETDPDFAAAHAGISFCHFSNAFLQENTERLIEIEKSFHAAREAVRCDEKDAIAHWVLGRAYLMMGNPDEAIAEFTAAIGLNPSFAQSYYALGWALAVAGRAREALPHLDTAHRLSPQDPLIFALFAWKALLLCMLDEVDLAWDYAERSMRHPNAHVFVFANALIIAAHSGRDEEFKSLKKEIWDRRADFSSEMYLNNFQFQRPQDRKFCIDAFIKAGIS